MKGHIHIDAQSSQIIQVDFKMSKMEYIDIFLLFDTLLRLLPVDETLRVEVASMILMGGIDKFFDCPKPETIGIDKNVLAAIRRMKEKRNEG